MIARYVSVVAVMINRIRRLFSRIQPYKPTIILLTIGSLVLGGLYTGRIPVTTTGEVREWYHVPPTVQHVVMLLLSIVSFAMLFLILGEQWDCQRRLMSVRVNNNMVVASRKCVAIWTMGMSLSSGLELLLRPYVAANSVEIGVIVAVLLALYGPTVFSTIIREIIKAILMTLLSLVVLVNIFVTLAILSIWREMFLLALLATTADGLLSASLYFTARRHAAKKSPTSSAAKKG